VKLPAALVGDVMAYARRVDAGENVESAPESNARIEGLLRRIEAARRVLSRELERPKARKEAIVHALDLLGDTLGWDVRRVSDAELASAVDGEERR
jgi:hypothetical protein